MIVPPSFEKNIKRGSQSPSDEKRRIQTMKKKVSASLAAGLLVLGCVGMANATPANWIDWTSKTTGTLTNGSQSIGVSLTGPNGYSYIDGDYYYNNYQTNLNATYGDFAPSDLIQVYNSGNFTLTFDSEITDPYISLVSVGNSGQPVSYNFNTPFSVITSGQNYWGYNGYTVSGNSFTGIEYNGILQLQGTFTAITFSIAPNENWHGFNFGTGTASPVPEPATLFLFGTGLAGLAGIRRKKK